MKITKYILSFILFNTYSISLASPLTMPPTTSELGLEEMLASIPHLIVFIEKAILPTIHTTTTQNILEWNLNGRIFRINFNFEGTTPRITQQGSEYSLDWPNTFNKDELYDYIKRLFLNMSLDRNIINHQSILKKLDQIPEHLEKYKDITPSLSVKILIAGIIKVFNETQGLPTTKNHKKLYTNLRNNRHKKILLAKFFKHDPILYQLVVDHNKNLDELGDENQKLLALEISELFDSIQRLPKPYTQVKLYKKLKTNRFKITFLKELKSLNLKAYDAVVKGNIAIENSI